LPREDGAAFPGNLQPGEHLLDFIVDFFAPEL